MNWNRGREIEMKASEGTVTRRGLLGQFAAFALAALGNSPAAHAKQTAKPTKAAEWDSKMELVVNFEISQPEGFRSQRPYVALWLEDKSGKEVRTLSLWVESGHGSRWLPDLRRWYRDAHDYWAAGGPDLILTMSSATRLPGKYSLTWDGKDDKGKLVPQGTYTVNLEVVREHGPYGLVQKEVVVGPTPFKAEAAGNGDIKGVAIEYYKRKLS